MKASLIISVYKNTIFLKGVLDSLRYQSEKDFEIIISEDGEDTTTVSCDYDEATDTHTWSCE